MARRRCRRAAAVHCGARMNGLSLLLHGLSCDTGRNVPSGEIFQMRFPLLIAASMVALASPAFAQGSGPTTYHGAIEACRAGQTMPLQLQAGRRYVISATSTAFDPVLKISRRGEGTVLAQDDDSGEGNNARLSFSP